MQIKYKIKAIVISKNKRTLPYIPFIPLTIFKLVSTVTIIYIVGMLVLTINRIGYEHKEISTPKGNYV